jgi:hypothetical protein
MNMCGGKSCVESESLLSTNHCFSYIKVPVCRYLNETSVLTFDQWFHPLLGLFTIINLCP